ncbi:NADPH-dependent FMN reductase [Bacillus sp. BRMEA1]|uniref:NADPH-dependent FMN reductase n=1 Tax=Neobacillus endophyticus TaxID=2738405 RepID=UPI0015656BA1|nr:NADPH-dependent FMN reductase [Neobacillus endophyticus]NRD79737.1 NADPH-dependent FMN reductase [Neobacillus endophyticus]
MSKITIVSGSPSEQTRLNGVLDYVFQYVQQPGNTAEVIQVRSLPAEDLIHANFASPSILAANQKVEDSEVLVILTPVYKASYTGVLKTYLDLLPQNSLEHKRILPIAVGGSFGHLLMIDYALKPVLAALGATHILKGAYIVDSQIKKLENNKYELVHEAKQRLEQSLQSLTNVITTTV